MTGLVTGERTPTAGDLVLARVDKIGSHSGLHLADGRRRTLFEGDEIVVAYGNRYAPNQFEAVVPRNLGPCHLAAAGGVAGEVLLRHARMAKGPTQIAPIGLLAGPDGEPVNLRDHALPFVRREPGYHPPVVAVVGTAMDSGKTQTAAHLVRGLRAAGLQPGYAKVTGTGAGGDPWLLRDAGADPVLDFTDLGFASTYLVPHDEVARILVALVAHLTRARADAIVLEIADGLLQPETAALLEAAPTRRLVNGFLFAGCDAMGAIAGSAWLRSRDLPLLGLSGVLTASPLQEREATVATGLRAFSRQDLADARVATQLLAEARRRRIAPARIRSSAKSPAAGRRGTSVANAIVVIDGETRVSN